MSDLRWPKHVIRKKSLTVTLGPGALSKGWANLLDAAMAKVNEMLKTNGVELVFSKAEKPINAHIVFDTESGSGLHGQARITPAVDGGKKWIDSIKILMPATPRISARDAKSREVGQGVRLHILVHELIHCIGLDNGDHTDGDVFSGEVQLFPGQTSADDKVRFDADHPLMPPIVFDAETIQKVQDAWRLPPAPSPAPL